MSKQSKICVIYNPAAARGSSGRRLKRIGKLLAADVEYMQSKEKGHVEELAVQAATSGFETVAAAGGDGTVHEVANGLLRADVPGVALGVLPLGSGNDYAASLCLPREEEGLAAVLTGPSARLVDVGLVESSHGCRRFFVNTLGFSLSAAVVWEIQHISGLKGMALYGLGALRAIWRHFKSPMTRMILDERYWETPTLFLTIALGKREGGGFLVAPDAELDDGWFDYLHGGRLTRLQALGYLPALAQGTLPTDNTAISRGRCRSFRIESDDPLLAHCDGELLAGPHDEVTQIDARLLPGRLAVRVPQ